MSTGSRILADDTARLRHRTLIEVLEHRGTREPDKLAMTYLADGATESARLTYGELRREAHRIGTLLLDRVEPGDRALLVYEPGLDFVCAFFGCLYAGVVGAATPAPELSRGRHGLPRLESVAASSGAALLLGGKRILDLLRELGADTGVLGSDRWLDVMAVRETPAEPREFPKIDPETLAYLQYTSGSTSTPKGVMVSHRNLMANLDAIRIACGYEPDSVSVAWMPHFHDYGLVEGILLPVYNGTPVHLMSPFAFVKRPGRWLGAISRYGATHTQGPNFSYSHSLRRVPEEDRPALDLATLRYAGNGAEPVRPETVEDFTAAFAPSGLGPEVLSPAYGLAEITLMATTSPRNTRAVLRWFQGDALGQGRVAPASPNAPGARRMASSGRALPGFDIAIVDPDTGQRLGSDRVGEIWIHGESVAEGYWELPEESARTFENRISGEDDGRRYLRTGDLGFLVDEELFVVSRLKDLIIIHGLNHHPQDIEWTVQKAHAALRPGNSVAVSVEVEGEEKLVVVQELERGRFSESDYDEIFSAISEAVADEHEVPVHAAALIKRGTLPKTSSGKVQRRACRDMFLEGTLAEVTRRVYREEAERKVPAAPPAAPGDRAGDLIRWLREYAEKRIDSRLIDERRTVPPVVILDLGNRGVFGLQIPETYGGLGLDHRDAFRVLEQLGAVDLSLATLVFLHNTNGVLPVVRHAREKVKRELLPRLASGRELGAFALSEPEAGSNLGGITARAVPVPGGWKVNGIKRWNASAWSNIVSVFARTEDAGRAGGLTGFVVHTGDAGVRVGPEALTMGMRGIMQNTVHLENAPVSAERVLGEPGRGMAIVEETLAASRLATAAVALGGMKRAAQLMQRYASRREIETGLLLENPQTTVRMSDSVHAIAVGSALLEASARALDEGGPPEPETAMAVKVFVTDALNRAADLLVQLLGGRGYMENNIAPQLFRDARVLSIGEGPNEGLAAAMGRSERLENRLTGMLARRYPDRKEIGEGLGNALETLNAGSASITWKDAVAGRLILAALAAAAAPDPGSRDWAERRFRDLVRSLESGATGLEDALSPGELSTRIASYADAIGDLEPGTPGIETDLDPLLAREAPPRNLEEKKRLLKKILEKKALEERKKSHP